jgi:pyruvate,water dikinase
MLKSMDRWIIDTDPGVRFPAWTRGNAADVFPDPASPFFASTYLREGLGRALVDAYTEMGVLDWEEVENPADPTMFGVFGGYVYRINRTLDSNDCFYCGDFDFA